MKTYYFSCGPVRVFSVVGLMAFLITSCGSYQNSSYDNDGIYGNGSQRSENSQNSSSNNQYRDYFGSLQTDEPVEIFTDVDQYRTGSSDTIDDGRTAIAGNPGWGSESQNIVVNVYDNNWGYGLWNNYWYGGWGWNVGWGYNNWYGPGWGMGWNNWYGPAWGWNSYYIPYYAVNNYYGNYYGNHYAHHNGIRGVRNDMYGNSRTSSNRANTTGRRVNSTFNNGTRSTNYSTTRNTRNATYGNTRNSVQSTTRSTTRSNNYNNQAAPVRQSTAPTRNYSPTRSTPSSGTVRPSSGGGGRSSGSYGGGGGGRSAGSGGRR